ncbi:MULTISPECIES: NAD-dependent succinate-semialdehyde dehydrogenase [unclassified Saccharopolyspora]|uniref:NAD-dependent succinate-semialdehyde dehydrogenase n=1 Tax=unclassified Saccharopolyspora TaxID=2646250 RepID=UPI001CD59DC9|nr:MULTISPECIES: NAD-dependent succinate-semialdehyde dehydrogenase [unclassified Saccharopolyspora]MCA1185051.1 NAD-dependent succinate-semialdehyde dehydrogenase [Saccharopolyspora sp. 6T]MCA1190766.1 NAD-dependent succinate-semialdehyde dehydrogenase [Saccharopolyspora sp. 6V]MCA1226263.1 NAD-dependent succinate-semialdehyde dehydrogenase [Saccharopolyspora sp. 6M]MCA1278230.1 NAD-dependent succinate-semialdehyde dehydrogenase [Saccharopolyspora sp. 7B]
MTEYAVVDPASRELISTTPVDSDAALATALGTAAEAQRSWFRTTTVRQRAELVARVGDLHAEHRRELADIIVREMGKPVDQALGEVDFCTDIYRYSAEVAPSCTADEEIIVDSGRALVRTQPLGVLLGIMPWNYPAYQVARFAAPNLALGNAILLKHAPQCPESAAFLQELFREAGLPSGTYTNIYADTDQVARLIADPRVAGVSLTGSERAGRAVAEIAGRHLKKVVLELGGSDPFVLLGSDDLDAAVAAAIAARIDNGGQACNAAKRIIVADDLYDDFADRFVPAFTAIEPGDPTAPGTALGPLSSTAAADRLEEQVQRAVEHGATAHRGGTRRGNFFPPIVLTGVEPANPAHHEEFFGPVAVLYRVPDEEAAISTANDTPFGLGSYVFTPDHEQAMRVADRLEAGMVFVNEVGAESAELPFGGVKASGTGRELGRLAFAEFVNKKMIRVP